MRAILRLTQEVFQADIFGFGALVRRSYPEVWRQVKENWHEIFSKLPVDIEVKPQVRRVGLTNSPAPFRDEQLRRAPSP